MAACCTSATSEVSAAACADLWSTPPELPPLPQNTIHIWRLRAVARLATEEYVPFLQPEEQARAGRFLVAEDRQQSIASRGTLRLLLAHYTGTDDPHSLKLNFGEHGKPYLAGSDIRFNVSHTRDLAIFAFARGFELGVDVERVRATDDLDDVAEQSFATAEREALLAFPLVERVMAFYRCWTRKEALLKADGSGLFRDLASFAVPLLVGKPLERLAGCPEGWDMVHLDVQPDAPGAIAWKRRLPAPQITLLDCSSSLLSGKMQGVRPQSHPS